MTGAPAFPFSAVVGQERMQLALLLNAVHPGIGGVLIRGTKGVAKSTTVRSLAGLLPEIECVESDPFNRAPGESIPDWDRMVEPADDRGPAADPAVGWVVRRRVPLVELPVGATEDRVLGTIHLETALRTGTRRFEPGLLAAAHRGILYIDEVNLLPDHLVDVLLDVAASGVNRVEREGVSFVHPSRFILIGTMNPEEGDLRPQLLDRFGLAVEVANLTDPALRAEVVRRRIAFEADPVRFAEPWRARDAETARRIVEARRRLPTVRVPDSVLEAVAERCLREGAQGMRADLVIYKAAAALAAYDGRVEATDADVERVAELALLHRRTESAPPPPPPPSPPRSQPQRSEPERSESESPQPPSPPRTSPTSTPTGESPRNESEADGQPEMVFAPGTAEQVRPRFAPRYVDEVLGRVGRRSATVSADRRGRATGWRFPREHVREIAIDATLRAAAPHQQERRNSPSPFWGEGRAEGIRILIEPSDLREKVRRCRLQNLVLFVVDASRSMGAHRRMVQTKAAVMSLLVDAYQNRDRVGMILFRGEGARLALPPTRSIRSAQERLSVLPVGGTSPAAAGLALAARVVDEWAVREPGLKPVIVLLSDGRANVGFAGGNPLSDALAAAAALARRGVRALAIDTEAGPFRLGWMKRIAEALNAEHRALDDFRGRELSAAVRQALFRSAG
jgi:magnesium chelatase subunit D